MKLKKIYLFLSLQVVAICATDQKISHETTNTNTTANVSTEKKDSVKNSAIQPKTVISNKATTVVPIKKAIFVNARVNDVILVITNHKNKSFQIFIKMGHSYEYYHTHPAVKVVCHEKLTPKTTVNKADLEGYTVFVFNDNQKTDKYHHISIREKNKAINHARQSGDISLFNDVCEETIYNP